MVVPEQVAVKLFHKHTCMTGTIEARFSSMTKIALQSLVKLHTPERIFESAFAAVDLVFVCPLAVRC